jgi:tRNA pseudouridine38-40 synthase
VRLFEPEGPADGAGAGEVAEPAASVGVTSPKAAPSGPLCRVRLLVAYDGGPFRGFAYQAGQPSVAGRLMTALGRMTGSDVTLTCAGRTDAGVHAAGQVVHADVPETFLETYSDFERMLRSLNRQVGPEVAVLDVRRAEAGFDARRSALARRYRYLVLCTPRPDPLLRHLTWHVPGDLDVPAIRIAADALLGEHDFSAFCRRPPGGGSTVRRVTDTVVRLDDDDRFLRFEIEANAFCHQMVRSMVGALVSVGDGRMTAAGVLELLRAGDRSRGARLAPPEGLCLELVRYPPDLIAGGVWQPPRVVAVA